jgi:hypothetical protein
MQNYLEMLWSSTKVTEDIAHQLATGVNGLLLHKDRVTVIKLTDTWWGIAGNKRAGKAFDKLREMSYSKEAPSDKTVRATIVELNTVKS